MKILRLCNDIFGSTPDNISIKEFFTKKMMEVGDSKKAFNLMCNWLGGRGCNKFLDYGLFALKLIQICRKKEFYYNVYGWSRIKDAVSYLLFDDRHDMYQNVPCCIDDIEKELNDEQKVCFYGFLVTALIECINVAGTEDQAYKIKIEEE